MKAISAILLICLFQLSLCAQEFWESIYYPDSVELTFINVQSDDYIFFGTFYPDGGVYRSEYSKFSWTCTGPDLNHIYDMGINSMGDIFICCSKHIFESINMSSTGHLYSMSSNSTGHQLFRTINPITYIESYQVKHSLFSVSPNPCTNCTNISLKGDSDDKSYYYDLYNMYGQQLVEKSPILDRTFRINTNNLTPGSYLLIISSYEYYQSIILLKTY